MNPALLLLILAAGSGVQSPGVAPAGEYESGIAAGWVREQDPGAGRDLEGVHLGFVAFSRGKESSWGFVGSWYAEWKESRDQEVVEMGVDVSVPYFEFARVGVGPRFRLGVQERAEPPHRGTDGVAGAGLEVGVRLSRRAHLAVFAERSTGFEAGARTSYGAMLRILLWRD